MQPGAAVYIHILPRSMHVLKNDEKCEKVIKNRSKMMPIFHQKKVM